MLKRKEWQEWIRIDPCSISINGRVITFNDWIERDLVFDAHNAALAAARNNSRYRALGEKMQEIGRLKQELAAERRETLNAKAAIEKLMDSEAKMEKELAALQRETQSVRSA